MSLFHDSALVGASGSSGAAGYEIERSLRFNSSDSAYLSRTPASAGNQKKWTYSIWVKRSKISESYNSPLLSTAYATAGNKGVDFNLNTSDGISIGFYNSSGGNYWELTTTQVFRDVSAWYHFLVAVDTDQSTASNRVKLYVNGSQITAFSTATYPVQGDSLEVNSTETHYIGCLNLNGTPQRFFNGYVADVHLIDGQQLDPSSFTEVSATTGQLIPKAYTGSFGTNGFWLKFSDNSAATATTLGKDYSGNNNNWTCNNLSVQGLLNYSSNVTTVATSIYNGTPATMFDGSTSTYYGVTSNNGSNSSITIDLTGKGVSVSTGIRVYGTYRNGMVWQINGSTVSSSGVSHPNTGWQTLSGWSAGAITSISSSVPSGSANEIYAIEVNGVILTNNSGAGNDSLVDTPTSGSQVDTGLGGQVTGNYCTWNPLDTASATLTNGNLDISTPSSGFGTTRGTFGVSSGKWYFEQTITSGATAVGVLRSGDSLSTILGGTSGGYSYYSEGSGYTKKINNNVQTDYGASFVAGDIIGVALDLDAGTITFYKNGSSQGQAFSGLSGTFAPAISDGTNAGSIVGSVNFGQRPFAYTAPSGFKALCDTNLPAPVVAKPSTVMDVKLITANNSTQAITGLSFSPDLVWTKSRSQALSHYLYDTVRGAQKLLISNATNAESTIADSLISFDASGFTLGANDSANYGTGTSVAWTWDAGSSTVTNTQGSITSQVRANASAGFSIVTYTGNGTGGATVGHGGLVNLANGMIIVKRRDSAVNWFVGHGSQGWTKVFEGLNTSNTISTTSAAWNNTSPTSTVFTLGTETSMNGNGGTFVAYCFAPVAGFSSFGSVSLNASADGAFIYLGFRPKFFMIKGTDTGSNWIILDSQRDPFNFVDQELFANLANAENTSGASYSFDFLSNGVKSRNTGLNGSFVYAAWAESPFAYSRAR